MPIKSQSHTLSTTASALTPTTWTYDNSTVLVKDASATIYLGGSDVSTANGVALAVGESISIDLTVGEILYAVASSGTPTVRSLQTRR